jgi:Tfp pilus assembly protein PilF
LCCAWLEVLFLAGLWQVTGLVAASLDSTNSAELDACRQTGKAYYENDDFKSAADQFRRCLVLSPGSAPDYFNLGLILMRATDYTNALAALEKAEQLDPNLLGVPYVRGILFKRQGRYDEAIANLKRVTAGDPRCVGAYFNLGICLKYKEQYDQAIAAFQAALEQEPKNPACHYQLITLHRRIGDVEKATRHVEIYDRIKGTVEEFEKTPEALERSPYSQILETPPLGQDLPAAGDTVVRFVDVTKEAGLIPPAPSSLPAPLPRRLQRADYHPAEIANRYLPWVGGAVVLGDYDSDGDLDIYFVNCHTNPTASANRLYRNESAWRFTDVSAQAGVGDRGLGTDAVFGDFDNDQHPDLYVVNHGPNVLYRNRGDGTFEDVSEPARANEPQSGTRAVFVDYDHDNDLDLLLGNGADLTQPPDADSFLFPDQLPGSVNTLLRNNGDGTFTDLTDEAGFLVGCAQTRDLVCADFDGDHDVDLFTANFDVPSLLFLNARLGKVAPGGSFSPPLVKGARAVAEADLNRDGHPDLLVAVDENLFLYTNDGRAHFTAGSNLRLALPAGSGVERIRVFDHDNDGWPDLLLLLSQAEGHRLRLLAALGKGQFRDVSTACGLDQVQGHIADVQPGDLDNDGDEDLVLQTRDRGPIFLRNDGGNRRHWLSLRLAGKKVNRSGYGATVEIASGGHCQKQTVRSQVVHFGLGTLARVHVVRVTWPNGVAQDVIQPDLDRSLAIEEYVKVSASCAFLWANGGQGFKLINEILGIGPLGVRMTPDRYFPLDCTELTKIEPGQLAPENGVYELRLTEDLREIAFLDQANLRVVDHPVALKIIPNEMFTGPPFPEDKFFAVSEPRTPRSARDDRGQDVLDLIRSRDGRWPTFPLTPYDGLAQPHSLTLDLGDLSGVRHIMLYLDGWIYWADSSVSAGLFQDPRYTMAPLTLEVRDADGHWRTAIPSVGLPTSKGMVVPVDLTGRFSPPDYHIRLATTLCVYFDRIFVSTRDEAARCRVTPVPVVQADLHYRGFARLHRDPVGYERFDYDDVQPTGSWNPPEGTFTRYGDVTPLLACPDDQFVIFGPGDELSLRFPAANLPELPPGWARSFLFYANGWVKDGDLNTQFSQTVEPLPFHGMTGYPYRAEEHYPDTPAHRHYLNTYNTRPNRPTVPDLRTSVR